METIFSTNGHPSFIIDIENTRPVKLSNITILDSVVNFEDKMSWTEYGALLKDGIRVKSGYKNVSYKQLLAQFLVNEKKVISAELFLFNGSKSQLTDIFDAFEILEDGMICRQSIVPIIKAGYIENCITFLEMNLLINKNTKIIFDTIYPSVHFQIRFKCETNKP